MERFTLKLAGIPLAVEALHPSTRVFCRDYLTEEAGKYAVQLRAEDIVWERLHAAKERAAAGLLPLSPSDGHLEALALYRKIVRVLLGEDILLFHGAGIELNGEGVLFIAPSGTGKTTHIRLWQQEYGARVINGDKPLLQLTDDKVLLCGTPWQGKEHLGENAVVPLRAIVALERGKENRIVPLTAVEALPALLQQSYRPETAEELRQSLAILDGISKRVRFFRLLCNMEREAARVAREGMAEA